MSLLMVRCPRTGQEVWTGIETDPDSFRKIPDDLFYTWCPHCGLDHAWWRDEAWLVDALARPMTMASVAGRGADDANFRHFQDGGASETMP